MMPGSAGSKYGIIQDEIPLKVNNSREVEDIQRSAGSKYGIIQDEIPLKVNNSREVEDIQHKNAHKKILPGLHYILHRVLAIKDSQIKSDHPNTPS